MTKYQLAKLMLMAGGLESRKRVQKTVHLLKAAGCPLDVDFRLHYYGPYSAELAGLLDRATSSGILDETSHAIEVGTRYDYRLSDDVRDSLEAYERTPDGQTAKAEMEAYEELTKTLCGTSPRILELASTMVAFHHAGCTWEEAIKETAEFKSETVKSENMTKARELARTVVRSADG